MSDQIEFLKSITAKFSSDLELKQILDAMTAATESFLQPGTTYFSSPVKTEFGTSGGQPYIVHEGKKSYDDLEQLEEALDELPHGGNQMSVMQEFPAKTKIRFIFRQNQPVIIQPYDVNMFREDIVLGIHEQVGLGAQIEALIKFIPEGIETGLDVYWTKKKDTGPLTLDFCDGCSDEIHGLYALLDGAMKSMYLQYKDGNLLIQTSPAFPEVGLPKQTITAVSVNKEFAARRQTALEAAALRNDLYKSLGHLHDGTIYLNVGGFSDAPWPDDSTTRASAKLRVIHGKDSTILITDGLSDIYSNFNLDKKIKYNGIGAEFYIEFAGRIEFEDVCGHFLVSLLNAMTQVALNHGDFTNLMKRKTTTTVQFTLDNVDEYSLRDGGPTNDISSFFPKADYKQKGIIGLLLGMSSKSVPATMQLNREEVLLINAKPFGQKWMTTKNLGSKDETRVDAVREKLIAEFEAEDGGNLVRYSYLKPVVPV